MKLFKKIYYPVMALCVALTVLFGFLSANFTGAPKRLDQAFIDAVAVHAGKLSEMDDRNALHVSSPNSGSDAAVNFIKTELLESGKIFESDVTTDPDDEFDYADVAALDRKYAPTLALQSTRLAPAAFSADSGKNAYIDKRVQNLVVYIPGSVSAQSNTDTALTADVTLISVRYDAIGPEATSAAVIGAAIEHIKKLTASAPDFKNDFLFVFADAGLEQSVGLYAFVRQFKGFGGIVSRIQFAADFDTRGNGGILALVDAGDKELAAVSAGTAVAHESSFVNYFASGSEANGIVADKPAVSYANIGAPRNQGTLSDNAENLSQGVVRAFAEAMESLIVWSGDADLASVAASDASDAVYFTYYNWFSVAYPGFVAMIIAGVLIVLLAAAIALNYKKKAFGLTKALLGALVQALSALFAALATFGVYILASLLLAGFGVINIHSIFTLNVINPGIIFFAAAVFAALSIAFYILLKKSFLVKAPDVARGNVFVSALVAVVLSFALPAVSYPFAILSALQSAVLLATVLCKNSFKAKFGQDIERLFLYVWPAVICMPLFIAAISLTASAASLAMLPVLLLMFALLAGGILPYADYLKPVLDKAAKKLPSRVIRYEEEVVEMVEDRAKKGKFTPEKRKKVTTEKIPWNYSNGFGVTAVAFVAGICMLLSAAFSGGFDARIVSNPATLNGYFYDGAFNYTYSQSAAEGPRFEVSDLQAYGFIAEAGVTMDWNAEKGVYEKSVSSLVDDADKPSFPVKSSAAGAKRLVYKAYSTQSRIKVTATGAKNVSKFLFNRSDDADDFEIGNIYEFTATGTDEITFFLPYDYGKYVEIKYEVSGLATASVTFSFEEQCDDWNNIRANSDIEKLLGNAKTAPKIRFNLIFKYKETI